MRLNYPYTTQSNNFFGFREHGNFESKSPLTQFDTSDGQPCYKFFKNFTLHDGHTLTTSDPCRGLYIYVDGDAYIGGTISMSNRGIYSPPTGDYANGYTPLGLHTVHAIDFNPIDISISPLCTVGATTPSIIACGGGGEQRTSNVGYGGWYKATGVGGKSGIFSGGAGAGGTMVSYGINGSNAGATVGDDADDYGGSGGLPILSKRFEWSGGYSGGGGCGNPGYYKPNYSTGEALANPLYTGTGGVLYLIVRGNIITSSTTKLTSSGINSGPSVSGSGGYYQSVIYYCGGGTGGGIIIVLYAGTCGTLPGDVAGGTYAGAGTFRKYQILK